MCTRITMCHAIVAGMQTLLGKLNDKEVELATSRAELRAATDSMEALKSQLEEAKRRQDEEVRKAVEKGLEKAVEKAKKDSKTVDETVVTDLNRKLDAAQVWSCCVHRTLLRTHGRALRSNSRIQPQLARGDVRAGSCHAADRGKRCIHSQPR
ncbi:hypothetical protein EON66_02035 [archaeon]|nr:MAG: hypothetical protein EON66_02035 [archaeon]